MGVGGGVIKKYVVLYSYIYIYIYIYVIHEQNVILGRFGQNRGYLNNASVVSLSF